VSRSPPPNTWFHRQDPRWKFAAFAILIVSIALERPGMRESPDALRDIPPAIAALGVAALAVSLSGFSIRSVLARIRGLFWVIAVLVIALPFLYENGDDARFSTAGLTLATTISIRSLAAVLLVFPGFLTNSAQRGFRTLRSFHVPAALILIVQFTHRYALVFRRRQARCADAMALRGFEPGPNLRSLKTWGRQVGTGLHRSIEHAENIAGAMKLRGYARQSRSLAPLEDTRTSAADVLAFLATVAVAGLLFWWRVARG
jgi:cobalt/nickel transport system permease protein